MRLADSRILAGLAAVVFCGTGGVSAAPPGAAQFAGELLQNHGYLFTAEQRAELDHINRALREAEHQQRKSADDAARLEAGKRLDAASARLRDWLEACPQVRPVSIEGGSVKPPFEASLTLSTDYGALVLRVANGEGEGGFVTQEIDEARPEHTGTIAIDCAAGTTWVLVGLTRLPVNQTILPVEFRRKGSKPAKDLIKVVTPNPGRVKVSILSDDTGKPAPAMVRITSKSTGRDYRPSNAVDFSAQFDGNGNNSGHRRANLPGRLGGEWWCVPAPFEMALPPGDYDIAIRRGVEHLLVFGGFTAKSGELTEHAYRPKRWVDMRHLGWYSGDDHVHCQILSDDDAQRLMAWIRAEDIHVANVVKMGDILRTYFEQRGFGPDYRVIEADYVASPGQECPRTHAQIGHTLSMNTTGMVRDTNQYYLYDTVADTVHRQGGLWGYAHVNAGLFSVHRDMSINVPKDKCDFVEVLQFARLGTDLYYDFLNLGFKLTASSGSDVPWGGTIGEGRVYAYIGDPPFSADAWFEAVRRGRTFVTNGPMLTFQVDDALPGDQITVNADRKLRVRARAWGHPEAQLPTRLQIIRQGQVVKEVGSPEGKAELSLDFEIDAGCGSWIAAKVVGQGDTSAHTTPVYVVRDGFRFWDFERVDELLGKRLASLAEIEQIVADAQAKQAAGELTGDQTLQQLATQGSRLIERVKAARAIYESLKEVAKQEAPARASH